MIRKPKSLYNDSYSTLDDTVWDSFAVLNRQKKLILWLAADICSSFTVLILSKTLFGSYPDQQIF